MAIKFDTFKTSTAGASDVTSVNGEQGDVVVTLDSATDQGATTTNSITVGGLSVGTAYSLPTADGSSGQAIVSDGSGNLSFTTIDPTGGLEYKGTFNATAGTPSLANAEQGDYYKIDTAGTIYGQTWAVGDSLLINADMGGTITNSKIDKIDNTESVTSVNSQTGAVNLGAGDLSDVTITGAVNGEVLKYNGTAWVDASVDYTEVTNTPTDISTFNNDANYVASGDNVSTLTNDAGYLTDITAEGLNDLSDVSFTAGVGIDGHVLTYDNTAGEWQAVAPASGGLSAVVQDTTPQLGGALDVNGQEITSASNGNVVINPDGTGEISIGADVVPDADATHTIGSEDNRYITTFSDLNGAIRFKAKNDEGAQITKGQAVYIKGLAGDGTTPTVGLADANDASKMPAFGLAFNTANDQAEVQIVQVGNLIGLNTSGFSVGDTLYIDTTAGALVNTKPTGETSQLQNIGRVIRSDNADGVIMVGGAGRSAATPNLDQNKIFLGNASNQSVSTALSSIALSSFNDDLSYLSSGDNVSTLTNDAGYLTDITGESIADLSDVTLGTLSNGEVLSYNGTNWVNSASSAGSLSGLSDVTITSAANGEVLKYNGTAWVDAQLAYSELSGTPTNVSTFTNDANYVASGDNVSVLTNDANYVASGDNVSVLTNDAGYLTDITGESIADLSDVTLGTLSSGEVLSYNGTNWVNSASSGGGYTVSNQGSSDFTASNNTFYYVNTASGTTTTATIPARTYSATDERIKFFNHGNGTLRVQETSGTSRIHPDESGSDPGGSGQSYKDIGSRSVIEFLGIPNTYQWEWAISAQLELGKDTLSTDGEVLRYDSSSDQMTALPFTFPTADGSANQILKTDGAGALTFIDQGIQPTLTKASPSANYTISTHDGIEEIYVLTPTANISVFLPSASSCGSGYKYHIKNMASGFTLTIDANSTETIDGSTTVSIANQYEALTLITDGSNWFII